MWLVEQNLVIDCVTNHGPQVAYYSRMVQSFFFLGRVLSCTNWRSMENNAHALEGRLLGELSNLPNLIKTIFSELSKCSQYHGKPFTAMTCTVCGYFVVTRHCGLRNQIYTSLDPEL